MIGVNNGNKYKYRYDTGIDDPNFLRRFPQIQNDDKQPPNTPYDTAIVMGTPPNTFIFQGPGCSKPDKIIGLYIPEIIAKNENGKTNDNVERRLKIRLGMN